MTKITWGASGEKSYESGVDQGVLYLEGQSGVPWNGLISVDEAPTGGSPTPYYIDGFKYLNISSAEEFAANIEAYTAPPEFAVCDGTVEIHNGLFTTQQPRKSFGFSYRTLIGNDVDGFDHGYKIHLVYNGLADPAGKGYSTLSDSSQATTLNWDVSTTPVRFPGYRPTSHLVVDSRKSDPNMLAVLEGFLYGAEGLEPGLPSPAQLVALFGNWQSLPSDVQMNFLGVAPGNKVTVRNRFTNPSFETSIAKEKYHNRINRPYTAIGIRPVQNNAGWALSDVADATTPSQMGRATRIEVPSGTNSITSTTVIASAIPTNYHVPEIGISSGYGIWVKHNAPANLSLRLKVSHYNSSNTLLSGVNGLATTVAPNVWTLLSMNNTPPGSSVQARMEILSTSTQTVVGGTTVFDVDMLSIHRGNVVDSTAYRVHGSLPDTAADTYSWLGNENDSASKLVRIQPAGLDTDYGVVTSSMDWALSGVISMKAQSGPPYDFGWASVYGFVEVGKVYTVIVKFNMPQLPTTPSGLPSLARAISFGGMTAQVPNVAGIQEIRLTALVDTVNNASVMMLGDNTDVYFEDLTIVEVPSINEPYTGPAFHGGLPNGGRLLYRNQELFAEWEGALNASASKFEYNTGLPLTGNDGDTYLVDGDLWVYDNGYWFNHGALPGLTA